MFVRQVLTGERENEASQDQRDRQDQPDPQDSRDHEASQAGTALLGQEAKPAHREHLANKAQPVRRGLRDSPGLRAHRAMSDCLDHQDCAESLDYQGNPDLQVRKDRQEKGMI